MKKWFLAIVLAFVGLASSYGQFNKRYFYYIGEGLIVDGKYAEAIDMLNVLLASDTLAADGFFLRGIAKYNLNDMIGAENDFTRAIRVNPVFTGAYQYRGITQAYLGHYDRAIDDFDKAVDIRPDREGLYYSRGITYFMSMQFEKAISDFDYFIRRNPYVVDAYINRGTSYLMLKDTTRAFQDYNKAVEINRYDASGFLRRGNVYLMREQYDDAYHDFTQAILLDSASVPAYFSRAIVYSSTNRPLQAIEDLNHVLALDPASAISYFNRAVIYSQIGDFMRARADYAQVTEYTPRNVLAWFNKGGINMKLGNIGDAEQDFTRAIELYPDFANAYLARSQARRLRNDMAGSKSDYETAERKVAEYRSKMTDGNLDAFADTTKGFDQLVSFDTDFGNKDFESEALPVQFTGDLHFIPMFRFAVLSSERPQSVVKVRDRYSNHALTRFQTQVANTQTIFSTRSVDVSEEAIRSLIGEQRVSGESTDWIGGFAEGAYLYSIKQYAGAVKSLTEAIGRDPDNGMLYMMRSVVNTEMTDFIASIDNNMQRPVIDANPSGELRNTKRTYSYQAALADADKAVSLIPDLAYLYYNRAEVRFKSGDMLGAIDDYTKALELHPGLGEAYYNRGLIQLYLKDSRKGVMDISKAGELGVENAYPLLKKIRNWNELK